MNKEDAELILFFDWVRWQEIRDPIYKSIYHVANERKTGWIQGKYLKKKGVRAGVFDVIIPIGRPPFIGAVIELKIKPNKLTEAQNEFAALMHGLGHFVRIAWSGEELIEIVKDYLGEKT